MSSLSNPKKKKIKQLHSRHAMEAQGEKVVMYTDMEKQNCSLLGKFAHSEPALTPAQI